MQKGAVPTYLLDRENVSRAKVLSNTYVLLQQLVATALACFLVSVWC